jgi:hypothetical protein
MEASLRRALAGGVTMSWTMRAQAQGRADTAEHQIVATIDSMVGSRLVVRTRTGHRLHVDALPAMAARRHPVLFVGRVVLAVGTYCRKLTHRGPFPPGRVDFPSVSADVACGAPGSAPWGLFAVLSRLPSGIRP